MDLNAPRYIIVSKLRNFARGPDVYHYFRTFGDIDIVRFLHNKPFNYHERGPVLEYTGCCVVEFKSPEAVVLVMSRRQDHMIRGAHVNVEVFRGRESHRQLLEKGRWRLWLSGLPNTSRIRNIPLLYDDKLAFEYIEDRFGQFGYNRAKIYKNEKYDYIGQAKLRFTSQAECHQAWNHAVNNMRLQAETWFN